VSPNRENTKSKKGLAMKEITLIAATSFISSAALAAVPNIFEPGQPASSQAVNQNFASLDARLSGLESRNQTYSREVDCAADSAALHTALDEARGQGFDGNRSITLNFSGTCDAGGQALALDEPGKEIYFEGQGADATINDPIVIAHSILAVVRNATVNNFVDARDNVNLGIVNSTVSRIVLRGNVSAALDSVDVGIELNVDLSSTVRAGGQTVIGSDFIVGDVPAGNGSPLVVSRGSVYSQDSGSLAVYGRGNGGAINVSNSDFLLGGLPVTVTGTMYVGDNSSFTSFSDNLELIDGGEDLGRGLSMGEGSSAHIWGPITFTGFDVDQDQALVLYSQSIVHIRGGGGVPSVVPWALVSAGAHLLLNNTSLGRLTAEFSTIQLSNTTLNMSPTTFHFVRGGGLLLENSQVSGAQLEVTNATVEILGSPVPEDQSVFFCRGASSVDYPADAVVSGTNNCFNQDDWSNLLVKP
jgi:hypothetical protein